MAKTISTAADATKATEAELAAFFVVAEYGGPPDGGWATADVFTRAAAARRLAELRGVLDPEVLAEAELLACLDMIGPDPVAPPRRRHRPQPTPRRRRSETGN